MKEDRFQFNLFAQTFLLFGAVFAVAFAISVPVSEEVESINTVASVSNSVSSGQPVVFLFSFALVTIVAFILVKNLKNDGFWKMFFGLGAFAGLFITLLYSLLYVTSLQVAYSVAVIGAVVILIVRAISKRIWLHNLVIVLSAAGVARLFGIQFVPESTALILAILALYDIIAVYMSKHMLQMARTLFDRQAFFGLIIPPTITGWKKKLADLSPGENISAIGAGDIALPLFFALSHLFHTGVLAFWVVTGFIFLGVIAMHTLHVYPARKRPMPALPPLVLFAFIGHWFLGLL